jgi:hypothetical protein
LLGSFAIPRHRRCIVLRHAQAFSVHDAEEVLTGGIALLGLSTKAVSVDGHGGNRFAPSITASSICARFSAGHASRRSSHCA